jgi:hypothetical protein
MLPHLGARWRGSIVIRQRNGSYHSGRRLLGDEYTAVEERLSFDLVLRRLGEA